MQRSRNIAHNEIQLRRTYENNKIYLDKMVNYAQKKNPRRIFINGLKANQINFDSIRSLFERFGKITAITMMQRHIEENTIHFGFVTFKDKESATKCLEETKNGIAIEQGILIFPQLANKAPRNGIPRRSYNKRRNSDRREHHRTKRNHNQQEENIEEPLNDLNDEETEKTSQIPEPSQTNNITNEDQIESETEFFDCY